LIIEMFRACNHVTTHVTVYREVQRFTPLLIDAALPCRHTAQDRWFVDETYVKVVGRWMYLYRAIDHYSQVIDVLVSQRAGKTVGGGVGQE
jgi:IS6 family transposase